MSKVIYINGQYRACHQAHISINDRGFQWGDSVYIVFTFINGRFIDIDLHLNKLSEYAAAIGFDVPFDKSIIISICQQLIRQNRLKDAAFYIQLTRGVAARVHYFPNVSVQPSLVITAQAFNFDFHPDRLDQILVLTTPDIRWRRASIKTNAALANVLLRQQAHAQGCFESWLTDDHGFVTEGASSNAYIVMNDNTVLTSPAVGTIVPGVTRERLMALARQNNISITEQKFDCKTAYQAKEAFITGAKSMIKSVVEIDGQVIGDGKPGVVTRQLAQLYYDYCTQNPYEIR